MKRPAIFILVALLVSGGMVAGFLVTRPREARVDDRLALGPEDRKPPDKTAKPSANQMSDVEQAEADYFGAQDASDRVEIIRKAADLPGAKSNMSLLRKAMIADVSEDVQLEAMGKILELAGRESLGTRIEAVRSALKAPGERVRQQALREARKHPSPELVPDLIEIADGKAAHRFLALDALAFTEDPRAKAKVLEVASKTDGDKTERVRAVALLARTRDANARELLNQLSASGDEELRKVALEVLDALRSTSK